MEVQPSDGVDSANVAHNRFTEKLFTFYAGASKTCFTVHADIVSPHSIVLDRLVDGSFKEGIERCADLPEVDAATFGRFLAYAYYNSSHTSPSGTSADASLIGGISISRVIEILLVNGHKKYNCKSCHAERELQFSHAFPQCSQCSQDELRRLHWRSRCVVLRCSRDGEYIQGIFCKECLNTLGVLRWNADLAEGGARKLQLDLPEYLEDFENFHFKIPLRVKDILGATNYLSSMPSSVPPNLIDTARLAIFADIYAVKPLLQAALATLYCKLTQQALDEESLANICELANHIYNNTPNRPHQTSARDTHVLRRIISQFIATYRSKFTTSTTFMELVRQEGELAGDILLAQSVVE